MSVLLRRVWRGVLSAEELAGLPASLNINMNNKFSLGAIYTTPSALQAIVEASQELFEFLVRHQTGDWGELSEEDRKENEFSLTRRLRLFSVYYTAKNVKIWVITEADRSITTILLPEEY